MSHAGIAFLVGEIGSGKTSVCQRLVEAARGRGLRVAGIVTQPLYDAQGEKTDLSAIDLWRGERRLLASLRRPLSELRRGPYSFDPATFAWAHKAVLAALAEAPALTILDEVGPLELQKGVGFKPLLGPLCAAQTPVLLVVRRECRAALAALLGEEPRAFEVSEATRDGLPEQVLRALCFASPPIQQAGQRPGLAI